MIIAEIREELKRLQDVKYRDFQIPIIPTVKPESMIGVRTPELRKLAKQYGASKEIGAFLEDLPHLYFEENQLHAFILSGMKDYGKCIRELNRFLPYVDNWATCDQMSPGFSKSIGRNSPMKSGNGSAQRKPIRCVSASGC